MDLREYILITPCKNEEDSLPKHIESVINQTIKPVLWVIVDDGSTDKTPRILKEVTGVYPWIKTLGLSEIPRDLGIHVAQVYRTGFQYTIDFCKNNNIIFNYIGVVDADIILDLNYFESLIAEFEKNSQIGICSGHIGNMVNGKVIWSSFKEDMPSGGARLWRKKCFEDTDGYILTCSPDSVSNVKAKLKGWSTKQFNHIKAVSTRPYASAEGQWIGYKKLGLNNYFIGYTPIHILLKGTKLMYSTNGYYKPGAGLAYIIGYFSGYVKKAPRLDDKEVIKYYKTRGKNILCSTLKLHRKTK
ncbi:MAG: glycosyltransferase family 2 protein [ANME-2 cluster archaeon]|nr:glycosyltransferase family 2 protein [ANME-2 cluster archaeon]